MISMAFDPMYQALIQVEQRSRYQNDSNVIVKRALDFDQANCEYLIFLFSSNFHFLYEIVNDSI